MSSSTIRAPVAVVDEVSKHLGDTLALDTVSLECPASGGSAIVGESGSGKSTLLSLLIGLLKPDSGRISVFGEPIDYSKINELRRKLGFAVQETGLFPHLRVGENICLPARLAGESSASSAARCRELAMMMNLETDMLTRYPLELSGGQQQRAGICRAMMLRPKLLLLDEPFSGLDIVTRREIYERFLSLTARDATSYVLVTHDLSEARQLCDHLIIIKQGKLIQEGSTASVLGRPDHPYVEKLIHAQLGHGRALS